MKFFLTPTSNVLPLFVILKSIFKVIVKSPDLLKLNFSELASDEEERIVLILKEKNNFFPYLIILRDGRIKKIESISSNFENLNLKEIKRELERKYDYLKQIIFIDKEGYNNIIKEVSKKGGHPFLEIVNKFQEEWQNERIIIYPLPHPFSILLELSAPINFYCRALLQGLDR